jgi:hypothetical protein
MRLIAVDARGGEVLDWDVPVDALSVTRSLNTSCMVDATTPAWYNARVDLKGHPVLLRQGTILVVEEDDGTLTPALMQSESLDEDLRVDGLGLSMLSKDAPWEWERATWSNHDVLSLWRHIWGRIIARSNVPRLRIIGDTSAGVTVGTTSSARWRQVSADLARAQEVITRRDNRTEYWERELVKQTKLLAAQANKKSIGEVTVSSNVPEDSDAGTHKMHIYTDSDGRALRVYYWRWDGPGVGEWYYRSTQQAREVADRWIAIDNTRNASRNWFATQEQFIADQQAWLDANEDQAPEPYELSPWANRDLSADLEHLRDLGDFDWYETATWNDDDQLVPEIHVVKDAGSVRDDLVFELGVNIHTHPELTRGDVFTHATVMGAGEGESTLQADRAWDHPRLARKTRTVSESDLGTQQMVNRAADREIDEARKALQWQFTSLQVTDTPTTPVRLLNLGDHIDVTGQLSDGTDLEQRVRVMEITRTKGESSIDIGVEPV